jgi:hypothetical protein
VHPYQLEQVRLGDGVALLALADDEGGDDRQRQRDGDAHDGAVTERGREVDAAADLLDVGADHVHADAAAGDVGDGLGGGEAGPEDEVEDCAAAHPGEVLGGDEALLDRLAPDPGRVDARPVVADLHDHLAGLVVGPQRQRAAARLAGGLADVGALDAVVDGVADQVGERGP